MKTFTDRPGVADALVRLALLFAAASSLRAAEPSFFDARVLPVLDKHCVSCHGPEKQKGKLRVDSFEALMKGGKAGMAVSPGDAAQSELFRRVTLKSDDDDVMPPDGKPLLSPDELKVLELWITRGASPDKPVADFADAPALIAAPVYVPLTADWRPHAKEIAALETELGLRLVPRSQVPADGLVLRTASAPKRCDDAALARLEPFAPFIVEAELARTRITDAGVRTLARFENLRVLDLTRTRVTSAGIEALTALTKLKSLNLTQTAVDRTEADVLGQLPSLRRVWLLRETATKSAVCGNASE